MGGRHLNIDLVDVELRQLLRCCTVPEVAEALRDTMPPSDLQRLARYLTQDA